MQRPLDAGYPAFTPIAAGFYAETLLGIDLSPSRPYQTFAGFLLHQFGSIPNEGDQIQAKGWRFEIVKLDGRRIDKVVARRD